MNSVTFENVIQIITPNEKDNNELEIDYGNDESLYDLRRGQPLDIVEIQIGATNIPRHSCANHKLNLSVRHSIARHAELCTIIKTLNSSNTHIRKCIDINRMFRNENCRLRLESLTRWSSTYLMLESVKRAYDKGI